MATMLLDRKPQAVFLRVPQLKLTRDEDKEWVKTRCKFLNDAPGFAGVFYKMMNPRLRDEKAVFTDTIDVAATDGVYVAFNPKSFFKYTLAERVFIVAHEVAHAIFNHTVVMYGCSVSGKVSFSDGTSLPYIPELFNIAADFVINAMLVEGKIGKAPKDCCLDKWYRLDPQQRQGSAPLISHKDSVPDAYRKLWKENVTPQGKPFDELQMPGTFEGTPAEVAKRERNEFEWKSAVAASMESARLQGKLPGCIKEMFEEIIEPTVRWEDHVDGWAKRRLGGGGYNFRKADRRYIIRKDRMFVPSRSGFGADSIVVAVDTSGSIGKKEVSMFFGHLVGVLEDVRPQRLWVIWCDAKVHRVDEVEDISDLQRMYEEGAPGRGGTDFRPVFDHIRDELDIVPDCCIYLTDGYGTFPNETPTYPVLWGSIGAEASEFPFGEVVQIPVCQE